MESVIKILNTIIAAIEIAIDEVAKVLDRAIVAIQSVSRKVISLFLAMFRLIFYLLPFVLFIVIGASKQWDFLFYIGIVVLLFVAVLFVRDFLVAFKEENIEDQKEARIEKAGRVIFIMIILNVLTVGYAVLYYFFNINIEQLLGALLQGWADEVIIP
uniref:Uncharacterized protein n=1 Tax=Candidatus Kentrum sp. TC TaxID=2126339 RepID=A0A450YCZ2_9GAMM|nr:MAG: hypothetical protein BECKTC1821D_GA0114238_100610 [Candidatus Kentron sp. TC]